MPAQAWVTLIVGGIAAIGVIVTWQQKNRADRRSEWWRRSTWAFERTFDDNDDQAQLGWQLLGVLLESTLATTDDVGIVQVIGARVAVEKGRQEGCACRPRNRLREIGGAGFRAALRFE